MHEADYAYAVARIRCNELKLLTKADLELLLSQSSVEECMKRLTDKGYGKKGAVYTDERRLLADELESAWELINEIAPDRSVFDSLKVGNDYHNLKAITESFIMGSEYESMLLYPCTVEPSVILEAVKTKDYTLLPGHMAQAAEEGYRAMVESHDSQLGEAIMDRACLLATQKTAKGCGELLPALAEHKTVTADIKIAMRCALTKKQLSFINYSLAPCSGLDIEPLAQAAVEGADQVMAYLESSGNENAAQALKNGMSAFEKWSDEKLRDLIAPAKYQPLGPDPLAAYLCAKELELRSVRIILSGKRNDIDNEKLRARLRELY